MGFPDGRVDQGHQLTSTGAGSPLTDSLDPLMSKRTKKATHRARKKKANHGRKPNRGRNS